MKKSYIPPKVKTEKVELGVFGCYGSSGGDFWEQMSPLKFIASLFKVLCCD
ncbi:hypothetical protein [Spirochaeta isovalerica]|uniref:RiPP n=1 Tax=Spirochaeta isovalerica TaxID=150 RepID=A0A841R713_9SPIO|nr:hypothetical protein [Spirochaeta isovalerica]MBB6479626.1 hypothetical protein [Spirochaeta isovalerica]